jgi:hypothetical protein
MLEITPQKPMAETHKFSHQPVASSSLKFSISLSRVVAWLGERKGEGEGDENVGERTGGGWAA